MWGILHGDVLLNNVMKVKNKEAAVKLIDFGIAVKKNSRQQYEGRHYKKRILFYARRSKD